MISGVTTSDVLIAGGGPAGSTVAWQLCRTGVNALLLDRATFPRDKVCAGWITPEVVNSLRLDLDDYQQSRVLEPIRSFRVGLLNRNSPRTQKRHHESSGMIQVDYEEPVSYGIRRFEFDDYLLRRCGIPVREGVGVRSIERTADGWLVNGQFRGRLLVGAGGHFCPVARCLRSGNDVTDSQHVVMAQEVEFELNGHADRECRIEPGVPELFFYPDLKGYAWCLRKRNWLNIGLGREGEQHLSQWRAEFVAWLIETGRIAQPRAVPFKGHAYRLNSRTPSSVAGERILLVGDAAGLADCHSGEGIRPAIESALLAADTVAATESLEDVPERYRRKLRQRFPVEPAGLQSLIPSPVRAWIARHMLKNERFVRSVVLDEWFLNRNRPSAKAIKSGTS